MEINWIEKERGFWIGKIQDQNICKISEHWTGCWLDGFDIPIVCKSVDDAKSIAQSKIF